MLNYQRLYEYRHRGVPQDLRQSVWDQIGPFIWKLMDHPDPLLDPAAGRGEFIRAIPAKDRWIVDAFDFGLADRNSISVVIGDVLEVELLQSHFGGVFVSNFLEHLASQEDVACFLGRMHGCLRPGGVIAVLGPNFKYCARSYFDCADHTLALTHVSVEEHLYAAGFEIERNIARFLPYSFRSGLPASRVLTRLYLRLPIVWRILGKQFLVVGRRP
jgi:SAM-dependent methyltransferase